ncbi:protein CbbY [Hydrogenophaga crassostreae]|uniref:Protein CbbY n=1 Tax=Hydrogenophaga crassostreae TaxID=1763535 RepID=A0A162W1C9_9BURK|nr:HAD-IA family hydrolase [Hydrogenophaga crassostreae]AOW14508.1 protein CbbY [Hydrogenophaga crassostreae]OAD43082.1 protein CbbY [Hydrogenophaga crassostreae]
MLKALIFDVDGTLADTEAVHLRAFNQAFAQEGLDWHWTLAHYTELLAVSGGKERMLHHWRQVNPDLTELDGGAIQATVDRLHEVKTAFYEEAVNQGAVAFRPGVLALMEDARTAGLSLAIATTTSPANIAALLRSALGADWRAMFAAIGDAGNAPKKKPHPQVYRKVLAELGLPASECLAIEDSSNGLQAARAAGLPTLITPNTFTAGHDFTGAMRVVPDLSSVQLAHLREWHAAFQP